VTRIGLGEAVDLAIEEAMANDPTIVVVGEDVHLLRPGLFSRFGAERVLAAPISENAFLGAAGAAAMAGLHPIVELYMVDFIAVAFDPLINHLAKVGAFSGGRWRCPIVVRAPSGAWYGDGGQHGQSLWGSLASIPGLRVVCPSTPGDAYGLTMTALEYDGPVVLLEPKLLSAAWLEFLGRGGRTSMDFDVPGEGASEDLASDPSPVPFGRAAIRRTGDDLTICSLAVGVHRALEAATMLDEVGVSCEVIDLRSLRPLDTATVVESVRRTGRLLVVDEDYREYGLSGELAATVLEAGLRPGFSRVCVEETLPYNREAELDALPNVERIVVAARDLVAG
jgi:pyruvate/2-oxoglutarate/acetoin dehydrogenase E1 component